MGLLVKHSSIWPIVEATSELAESGLRYLVQTKSFLFLNTV